MDSNDSKYIYFISAGEFVKIGISGNPKKRLDDLQVANPIKLNLIYFMPGDEILEKILHETFDDYRECGEWFRFENGLKSFVYSFRNNGFWIGQKYADIPPTTKEKKNAKIQEEIEKGVIFLEVVGIVQEEYSGRAPINILLEDLADEYDIPKHEGKKLIQKYRRRGRIYTPQSGYLRVA